ncbi:MAG: type II secretion system protein [Pseudomonadota bacterium]|nr:type II secretion system protein [Pseudomonadota bacterium]
MAPRSRLPRQGGFTYLGLIILVTVIGMVGAATLKIGALLQRAQAEDELLDIGAAFSAALQSYAAATPAGQMPVPPSLQELLKDPRTPALRRHLRKLFVDPVTGGEWGIVYQADKVGVLAVYSRSQARPLKIGNFDARFIGFDNKEHLSDWKFGAAALALPPLAAGALPPQQPQPPPPPPQSPPQQPPQPPQQPPQQPQEAAPVAQPPEEEPKPADDKEAPPPARAGDDR